MEAMSHALFSLGLIVVLAKITEGVLRRFRLNSIVAYTLTGVLVGPASGIVGETTELQFVLSIGIFLFFFLIGLNEIDVPSFAASVRLKFIVAATVSFVVSLAVCWAVASDAYLDLGLGLTDREAVTLAGVLSLSSLGIIAKVLSDEDRMSDPTGMAMFTTVLIIELMALMTVGFSMGEEAQEVGFKDGVVVTVKIALFAVLTWIGSKRIIPPAVTLLQRILHVPQLSFGLILGMLFIMVSAAELVGVHGSLGALLFGASLSGLPYQLRRDLVGGMRTIADGLFVPIFFAAAGLKLNLEFVTLPVTTILAVVIMPLAGKFAGSLLGSLLARVEHPVVLSTGMMAKGITEIGLLLVLVSSGVIGEGLFSLLVLTMFGCILVGPPIMGSVLRRLERSDESAEPLRAPIIGRFALADVTVDELIDRKRQFPQPTLSVKSFLHRWAVPGQYDYLVVAGGKPAGTLNMGVLRYLPKENWAATEIGGLLSPCALTARTDESVEDVLHDMQRLNITVVPVFDASSGELVGSVTSQEILDLFTSELS